MSDDRPVDRAFADHDAFESGEDGYVSTATPFDATVRATRREDRWQFRVTVRVPTLPEVVEDQEVGDAVASGWFDTFSLRVEDAYDVTRSGLRTEEPTFDRDEAAGQITVELGFEADDPVQGGDDAAALVDYVEGTYVQGVIPGYEYGDPVASLVHRARRTGGTGSSDDRP